MTKFRWSNIPIPEGHVFALVAGVALNWWCPLEFWQAALQIQVFGWTLLLIGILLAIWATTTFSKMDFSKPTAVVASGPYALSRNPMYVAWTLMYRATGEFVVAGHAPAYRPAFYAFFRYP